MRYTLALVACVFASVHAASARADPVTSTTLNDLCASAVKSAIDDVLQHAIAFSPTFVSVQSARVVGGRVYLLLLIGDDDGAATLKALSTADDETTSY